jgi:hypothetical protein
METATLATSAAAKGDIPDNNIHIHYSLKYFKNNQCRSLFYPLDLKA